MAEIYFPFDSGLGSNVGELYWSLMARHWLSDGVISGVDLELETYADSSGMQVKVRSGAAWIKGHYYGSDAEQVKTISTADATNPRIDRVVVRLDWTNNLISIEVKTGTPAATPSPPALTHGASVDEFSIAQVLVGAGVATITSGNVTDERVYVGPNLAANSGLIKVAEVIVTGSPVATIDFQNIPSAYRHLELDVQARSDGAVSNTQMYVRFNNDSGNNYDIQSINFPGGANNLTNISGWGVGQNRLLVGLIAAGSALANRFSPARIQIPNYSGTNAYKNALAQGGYHTDGSNSGNQAFNLTSGLWRSTVAIDRVTLLLNAGNFVVGSVATLYARAA